MEVLDLRDQLREAMGAQELVAEGKALDVSLELPEGACLVLGDATRMQQVLWNLMSNAIKFTPAEGKVKLRLEDADILGRDEFGLERREQEGRRGCRSCERCRGD